ncbi:hypothetical protein KMB89_gp52 [Citrobacter phage HCF1]|uniref:Uncharacterized protein n=1 Tax=Citrobacter phage HCF1 TaxID=2849700 RepID=A0ABX6D3M6_9CAUD|nr:hypothetical protein KMB89_gp52 [Citrobacter phage HCF1]
MYQNQKDYQKGCGTKTTHQREIAVIAESDLKQIILLVYHMYQNQKDYQKGCGTKTTHQREIAVIAESD